jgi:hypothetical protein
LGSDIDHFWADFLESFLVFVVAIPGHFQVKFNPPPGAAGKTADFAVKFLK